MKKRTKLIIIIIAILVIIPGFLIGMFIGPVPKMCTMIACGQFLLEEVPEGIHEIPCNSCSMFDPIFTTGIFNVWRSCSGKEIMIYDGEDHIDTKYNLSHCEYEIGSLDMFFRI